MWRPKPDACDCEHRREGFVELFISRGDAAQVLELAEQVLYLVVLLVDMLVQLWLLASAGVALVR